MYRSTLDKLIAIRDEKKTEDGGFTLIELLVVVVIIGILIAIAIPLYLNYENGAKNKGAESDVRAAVSAVQQCYTDNGNQFPAGATNVVSGSPTNTLTLSCNGNNETSSVTTGDTITYAPVGTSPNYTSYTITGKMSGGSVTYKFDSTTGQVTQQ